MHGSVAAVLHATVMVEQKIPMGWSLRVAWVVLFFVLRVGRSRCVMFDSFGLAGKGC